MPDPLKAIQQERAGGSLPVPTEHEEQKALIRWVDLHHEGDPIRLLFAIPNGGKRPKGVAGKMKAEGVRRGVPDLFLPIPRKDFLGFFIEMKKRKGGRVTEAQRQWHNELIIQGYLVQVCCGWEEAAKALADYLGGLYSLDLP